MGNNKDILILRDLAKRYAEVCAKPVQDERRGLWRDHNSFVRTGRVPVYVYPPPLSELPGIGDLQCEDPFYQGHEYWLRAMLFWEEIGDDRVLEPWITQRATVVTPEGLWGLPINRIPSTEPGGAWQFDASIKTFDDAKRMVEPKHVIDEESTAANVTRLNEAVGDILEVNVDRSPAWFSWGADISTYLAYLRGLEQVFWDMADNPEWLHGVLAFMRDGILKAQEEAEQAGDWRLANHDNQAAPYSRELPDPEPNGEPVTRDKLWTHMSSQEFTLVSPAMHDEFMLAYQIPIMSRFGLSAYGCCEDLSEKIDILRQVPNLRRIAVAPRANVRRCADQIGTDFIFSYRPNPSEMVCCGFDPDHIRRVISDALVACEGCYVDITLKDVQTLEGQPERLKEWVRIVRELTEEVIV